MAEEREKARIVGYLLGGIGILAGIVGAVALTVGYRGRQVIQPIPEPDTTA